MTLRGALRVLLGVACLLHPALAETPDMAETPQLEVNLDYVASPRCPDSRTFEHTVASRLGYFPFRIGAPHRVLVRIEAAPNPFGHVEWRKPSGEWAGDQSFPAHKADCVELARTIAVALAVQIHLLAVAEAPESVSSETPSAPRQAQPVDRPELQPTPAYKAGPTDEVAVLSANQGERSLWRFGLGGGVSLAQGLSSSVGGAARLFTLIRRNSLSLEVGAEVGLPSVTRRADGAGYSQQLLFGSLAGCGGPPPWSACVLTKIGMASVRGRDIDLPASDSGAILQAGLRAAVSPRLGELAFFVARIEGLATLTRWTVTLDGLGVWTAPPIAANVGLDLGVLIP